MAVAYIRFGACMGGGAPVLSTRPNASQDINTTASNQVSTITARSGDYCRVVAVGGGVRVAFAGSPVATATSGDYCPAGVPVDFGPLSEGDKIAVIDAT